MASRSAKSSRFAKGLLIGAVVGAAATALLTPKTGKEAQKKVSRVLAQTKKAGAHVYQTAKSALRKGERAARSVVRKSKRSK